MRKMFFVLAVLTAASFIFTACEPAANTTTANRPANMANNAMTTAPVNTAAIETDIKKMIADVYAALAKNDVDALDKFYGDTYTLVDLDGSVKSKAERFAELRSGDVKFESISADEISVRVNPEGTGAVSIARATTKATNKGVATGGQVRVTTVWSKTKDGWKTVSAQATRITGPATSSVASNTANANKTVMTNTAANTNR